MSLLPVRHLVAQARGLSSRASFTTATRACWAKRTTEGASGNHLPPQLFTQTVVLTDGSSVSFRTTSPRPLIQLTKDPRNHPLWNPEMDTGLEDDSGRLIRFTEKFGEMEDLEGLQTFEEDLRVSSNAGKGESK